MLSNLHIIFLSIFWIIKFKTLLLSRNLKQMPGVRIIFFVLKETHVRSWRSIQWIMLMALGVGFGEG
jgi:hypothetical protein